MDRCAVGLDYGTSREFFWPIGNERATNRIKGDEPTSIRIESEIKLRNGIPSKQPRIRLRYAERFRRSMRTVQIHELRASI